MGQWLGKVGGRLQCPHSPSPRCLHEYFNGLHCRCANDVWCGSQPSFWSEHPSNNGIGEGFSAYPVPVPDACMSTSMGFIVGVRMMFGVVVSPVFGAGIPVITELVLRCTAMEPPEAHILHLLLCGTIVLLATPAKVELSV